MWITAKNVYITKCVLWILGAVIIPIFIWWRPAHIYKTDKSSIVIEESYMGRKFEFDATNSFGCTLHAEYVPDGAWYKLIVDGEETCYVDKSVSEDSFIYDDTHVFVGCDVLSILGSILCAVIQLTVVIVCIFFWSDSGDVDEYVTWKSHEFGFSVKNVWGTSKNDFWFSKVFGLYITEESLVKINKFFGFDNPYLDNNNN